MQLFNSTFEKDFKLNKIFLKSVFIISLIFISVNFYEMVVERSYYEYSDWLINYQGGFARRGLIGEILYTLYSLTNIRLDLLLYLFVMTLYITFFYFLFKILDKTNLDFLNTLIVFSPLSFIYLATSKTLAGRKEILLFFLITIFFYKFEKIKFNEIKYWLIFILIASSLTHFGFIFYMPFLILFFIYFYNDKSIKELVAQILPVLVSGLIIFFLIIYVTIYSKPDIFLICESIKDFTRQCPEETYVRVFTFSLKKIFDIINQFHGNNYIIKYPIYYILAFAPIYFALFSLKDEKNFKAKYLILLLITSTFFTLPVFLLGADYGRYFQWQYMFYLLIYLKVINLKILKYNRTNRIFSYKIPFVLVYLIVFFYGFFWSVPHCCEKDFSFLFDKIFLKLIY
jgi:hypothetical protein